VIVVDNGSRDGSVELLSEHLADLTLMCLSSNIGFGAACNRAIAHALQDEVCEYVFLVNNDAIVAPQAVSELVDAARAHPQVGILGAKVYCRDEPHKIWYAGARERWGVLAAAGTGRGRVDRGQFDVLRRVDYVFGAAMFVRRAVFETSGVFDERFFLYLEDLDFCLRARSAGFSLLFVPQAHVWHGGSVSTAQYPALRKYHLARSTWRFLKKHSARLRLPVASVYWPLVFARAVAFECLRGDLRSAHAYLGGLFKEWTLT